MTDTKKYEKACRRLHEMGKSVQDESIGKQIAMWTVGIVFSLFFLACFIAFPILLFIPVLAYIFRDKPTRYIKGSDGKTYANDWL